ncbi:MAG: nucleotidyltransferase family protein [Deltaproteobacteria bacterium]|nr:nucleotidyltransferase family protein [Deltaproteobacteria bacterium]
MVQGVVKSRSEERFILSVVRELPDPGEGAGIARAIAEQAEPLDWNGVIRRMSEEGIASLFYHLIDRFHLQPLLPPEAVKDLSDQYFADLKRNMAASAPLRRVFDRMNERRLPFIVLKGIALAELIYPGFATRGMSDADILVRKADMEAVDACLSDLGYSPVDSTVGLAMANPMGYLASLDYRLRDGSLPNLHIHWHPVNTSVPAFMFAGKVDLDRIWERSVPVRLADADARVLGPEHQVIYLCEHALRVNHSFDRLILICDILYALRAYGDEIRWEFLVEEARRFGLAKPVFLGLTLVGHYTLWDFPEAVQRGVCLDGLTWGERLFLRLQRDNRRFRGGSILVYLAMNRGILRKVRFAFRVLFPPRHILAQRRYAGRKGGRASDFLLRFGEVFMHLARIVRHRP